MTKDDLISRQAAIEVIDAAFPVDPMKSEYTQGLACGVALAKTYVEQLPSAQSEQKKGEWEEIEVIPEAYDIAGVKTWASKMRCNQCGFTTFAIEGGFAQYYFCPNCGSYNGGEPMSDLISRQAAIDALVKAIRKDPYYDSNEAINGLVVCDVRAIRKDPYYDSNEAINGLVVCDVRAILNDLPSAQSEQKKGEWIEIMDADEFGEPYPCGVQCSECGFCSVNLDNFCPNCGSYNGGEQE